MYGFTTTLTGITFDQALARTIEALKGEGYGVLSDIDLQGAMTVATPLLDLSSVMQPMSAISPKPASLNIRAGSIRPTATKGVDHL